jgi:hypothetical protein
MDVAECMEAYQREQKRRKVKIKVGKQHDVGCLHIGQKSESFFPNMRVRHGVHMQEQIFKPILYNTKKLCLSFSMVGLDYGTEQNN